MSDTAGGLVLLILLVLVSISFEHIRHGLNWLCDVLFFRRLHQAETAFKEAATDIDEADGVDALERLIVDRPLQTLQLASVAVFRREGDDGASSFRLQQIFPLFMVGFIALVVLNSVVAIPAHWRGVVAQVTTFLLTMSLGAIGLETSVRDLRHQGIRPMLLTVLAALFIATLSLVLITVLT